MHYSCCFPYFFRVVLFLFIKNKYQWKFIYGFYACDENGVKSICKRKKNYFGRLILRHSKSTNHLNAFHLLFFVLHLLIQYLFRMEKKLIPRRRWLKWAYSISSSIEFRFDFVSSCFFLLLTDDTILLNKLFTVQFQANLV